MPSPANRAVSHLAWRVCSAARERTGVARGARRLSDFSRTTRRDFDAVGEALDPELTAASTIHPARRFPSILRPVRGRRERRGRRSRHGRSRAMNVPLPRPFAMTDRPATGWRRCSRPLPSSSCNVGPLLHTGWHSPGVTDRAGNFNTMRQIDIIAAEPALGEHRRGALAAPWRRRHHHARQPWRQATSRWPSSVMRRRQARPTQ